VRLAPTPRAPRLSRAALIVAVYTALGAAALAWGWLRGHPNLYLLDGAHAGRLIVSPLVGLALALASVFLLRVAVHRLEWARVLHRELHAVVHELSSREIFILALSSSIGEELFFRGALLPKIGVVASSLLFAALHMRPHARFLPWTAMSFIFGVMMGIMYLTLGDLGGPIVAHFTINLLNLHYISRTELRS
jgi:membrane protease YdiL (CAAX protease family)